MKRKITIAIGVLSLFALLLVFASCGEHEHAYGSTWETDGSYHWNKCTVEGCDAVGNNSTHKFGSPEKTAATCTEKGVSRSTCVVCGYEKVTEEPALGHEIKERVVDATCEKDGYTRVTCQREGCDYSEKKDIVPAGHKLNEEVIAPTCTEGGKTVITCTNRGCDYYQEKDAVDKLGHDRIENVIEPTCTTEGYTAVSCSRCDFEETINPTEMIPHNYNVNVVPSTCTEGGYTSSICISCGDETEKINLTDPLGHALVEGTPVAPTCEDDGYTPLECSRCDYAETKDIVDALGHNEQLGEPVAPDCRNDGYTPVTCSRCDYTGKTDIVPTPGHTYYLEDDAEEGTHYRIHEEPTCDTDGKRLYRCTVCKTYPIDGDKNVVPIPALGHDEECEVIAPTCTLKGTTIVTCKRCDYEGTKDDVDPLGHSYYKESDEKESVHYEVTLAPTCTEKGEKTYYCQREGCGLLVTDDTNGKGEIPALNHSWVVAVEPWCGNEGAFEYVCDRVCRETECTETKTEVDESKEYRHTFNASNLLIPETCVDFAIYECPVCQKTFTAYEGAEVGQPTGAHRYENFQYLVEPTCTEKGYTVYSCVAGACGLTQRKEYTDIIPHTLSDVSEKGTVTCMVCNKSYIDVTAEKVSGSDKICICGQDPCICDGTTADWEGFAKPKDPMNVLAGGVFTITEVEWSDGNHPLEIGYGLIVLNSQEEATFTVIIYAEDGSESLYTFDVSGKYAMIDLYQYETVGKVEIITTVNATVSFYQSI